MNIFKNLLHLSWLLLLVLSLPKFATAQISCDVVASVSDNLSDVIAGAVDGESICLEPGEHTAGFFIRRGDVTITSQAPDNPAVVTGGSYVFNVLSGNNNIVFDNLILDGYSAEALYIRGDGHRIINNEFRGESLDIELNNATNIAILDNLLSGGVGFNTTNVSTAVSRFTHNIEGNIFADGKVLFYTTDEDNPQIPEDAGQVIINNSTNVNVSGFSFFDVSVPVQVSHSPGAVIDNNDVRNLKNSPLSTLSSGAISVWESEGAIISNNTIDGVDARAIFIDNSPISVIRENSSISNLEGVIVRSSDNAQVILNQIDGTTNTGTRNGNGINIVSSESVEILDNDITNNEGYGIFDSRGGASEFAVIRGNTISGNNSDGISWRDVSRVTIDNNRVINNRGTGIIGSRFSTISNNIVTDNTSYGIDNGGDSEVYGNEIRRNNSGVSTTFRTEYYDNIISDNEYAGIYVGNVSDDITIRENTFSGNKVDVRFNSTKEVILRDNTMETGIFLYSSANEYSEYDHIIERNTVAGQPLVYIKGEMNPIIDPNAGQIILFDVSDATIENYSMSNIFVGVHVLHSQNVLIDDITVEGVGDIQDQNTGLIEIMNSVDVTVQNSTFSNARKGFEISRSEDVAIVNNTINRTEGVNIFRGAFAKLSPRLVFRENTINALRNGYGIDIDQNSHNSIITDNQIYEAGNDAIRISRSDSTEILSNTLTGGDSNGIYLSRANSISIIENQISEFQMNGIETVSGFSSSDDITLTNNVIVRNIGTGIKLQTENAELVGNRIEENSIGAELNSYFVADSNAVRNNTNEGFLITGGVNDSSLFENIITGNGSGVVNNGSGNLMAPGNWWGDASGPSGGATDPQTEVIANGSGDSVSENVRFDPWLTEDPNSGDEPGGPEPGEATVEFRDQSISSGAIFTGGIVNIQAVADNIGEIPGSYYATLSVNGVEVQQAEGYVEFPGSDVIQFFYQINEPGQYSVSVEGLPEQTVSVEPGWTQYQFNSDNTSAADFLSGPETVELRTLWEYGVDAWMASSPVVAESVVYFGSNSNSIYAVNEETGELKWEFQTDNSVRTSPALFGDILIAGNSDGILFGLDKDTGEEIWRFTTEGEIRSNPTVANGIVYFGVFSTTNGQVYAVDAETGNDLWSFPTGSSIFSSPAISEGVLYIGSNDNSLYALDITGDDMSNEERLIWSFEGANSFSSTPVVYNEFVYASTGGFGEMDFYAFDKSTGEVQWSKKVTDRATSAAVYNDTLYVGSGGDAELFALAYDTGTEYWSTQFTADFGSISLPNSSPVIAGDLVYVSTSGTISGNRRFLGLDKSSGTERFRVDGFSSLTSPVVINERAYLGVNNRGMIAFREVTEADFIPDAEISTVNVTSPHWADGQDQAQVEVEVYSSSSDPITGLTTDDFEISAGNAGLVGEVEPQFTDGRYRLYIANHVAETVPVSVTINGVELAQQPNVEFKSAESNWNLVDVDFGMGQWNQYADVPAVHFINESTGWLISSFFGDGVADNQTVILRTDDSGENWSNQYFSNDNFLSDIHFIDETHGWAVSPFGTVLRTVDGGENWKEITVNTAAEGSINLNKIYFVDENIGFVGGSSLYKSTDGGESWSEVAVQENISIQDIDFYDQNYGMIAVYNQTEMGAGLFITEDGGISWSSEFNGARFSGVDIVDENRAFVVGSRGLIVTTNDGGNSWEQQYSMVQADLTSVSFADDQTGWVVGNNSTILTTSDSGTNWTVEYPGSSDRTQLYDVQFVNDLFGWASGRGGTVLKYGEGTTEPPLATVDADSSTVTATSPHLADGEDRSMVVVQLSDSLGNPIDRFNPEDLQIEVSGSAQFVSPDVTGNPGEYAFMVSNTVAESVTVSVTVDEVLLSDQ
uniref:right-handed parallel beta-helix repeat-containing protein n=1 Tax=Rhodohalobacter halophilus TaxID=1812810 RepID=UPI00083F5C29